MIGAFKSIIGAIISAFKMIAKRPWLLAAAFIAVAINLALLYVFFEPTIDLVEKVLFLEILPESAGYALPFHMFSMYGWQLSMVAISSFLSFIVTTALGFFYAAYARDFSSKRASMANAFRETLKGVGNIFSFAVFFWLIAAAFFVLLWAISLAAGLAGGLSIVMTVVNVIVLLLAFYIGIKFAFVVPVMAIEKAKLRQALQKSWRFSGKTFWMFLVVLVFLAVISSVNFAFGWIGAVLGEALGMATGEELAETAAIVLFALIGMAFYNIALPAFYLKRA